MNFVTIDPAMVTGIAYLKDKNIFTGEVSGTPIQQFYEISLLLQTLDESIVVFEELNFFRNAKTVRSLSQRVGYLNWRLIELGYQTMFINTMKVRKYLDCKTKDDVFNLVYGISQTQNLSYNMTDAIAILLHVNQITVDQLSQFAVQHF
jgi:hypothetical protein